MTRIQTAIGRHADRLIQQDGRSVDYRQGSHVVSGISAVPTDEEYTVSDGEGGTTKIQSNDWIVRVADLEGLSPQPGDQIHEQRGSESRVYELQPIGNKPCCEEHDSAGVMFVMHTKRIQ